MKRAAVFLAAVVLAVGGCSWKSTRLSEAQERAADLEVKLSRMEGELVEMERTRDRLLGEKRDLEASLKQLGAEHQGQLDRLRNERDRKLEETRQQASQEANELVEAQRRLAEKLRKELGDAQAKLEMTERGLVLTMLNEIFFDSGKAEIKESGKKTLEGVASVLKETVPDSPVAVEGHTDDDPIKYSGWKSNWELSTGRALAVVHYFVDQQGVAPDRLRAVGYGQFHPVAPNATDEGKRQNRRVEVVILPKTVKKAWQ
ncbi:MAG: hypothetical protein COV76_07705 [Candidatus Omnitrophica bacterium CG11_big_fil_rev_8_21_14_0_20_64_10]|nr:MAG: hypothetical protein COV76_07705 [Candidatus Omnitrophica bacterium CG11_big_fil_rev_8_21_14_0_20_64_10]